MKDTIKILGAYGGKSKDTSHTSILVSNRVVIDAGNIINGLNDAAKDIDHIFITHAHLDHIVDIPFLIDSYFETRDKPLTIYALSGTLETLKKNIFNWHVWPDFTQIEINSKKQKAIVFKEIKLNQEIEVDNCILKPIQNNHTDSSCGYVIQKNNSSILFTSDTYVCKNIWDEVNNNKQINSIIIDVSFPSRLDKLAKDSKHLTPKLLENELLNLKRDNICIYLNHLKPFYINEIVSELSQITSTKCQIKVLKDFDTINIKTNEKRSYLNKKDEQLRQLNEVGYALTAEKDIDKLMEKILSAAKDLTNADAGTFYLMSEDEKSLQFKSVQTDSLNIKLGGKSNPIPWPNLQLYNEDGSQNNVNISASCALNDKLINIPDVYKSEEFIFEGPKAFDAATGYKTTSMLVVPMKNHENDVIGVLQLINKKDEHQDTTEFNLEDEKLVLSMSSQAAVIVSNVKLIHELEKLLDSFIQSIATAIGEKSKYTAGHINRVADLTTMIATAINEDKNGVFKDKYFDEDQIKELDVAAWMHDIGKIVTPEYVVDKAKKLQTIYDRIGVIELKFELFKKDLELEYLRKSIDIKNKEEKNKLKSEYQRSIKQIDDDLEFIKQVNTGGEFLEDDKIEHIKNIAKNKVTLNNEEVNLLSKNEVDNLCIRKGTLTDEERFVINNHAKVSFDMLDSMPFPKKLKNVPKIAAGHHEKIRGGGYPFGLKGDEISFESRILAIADIFEALTAHDRPYKEPNSLNQSMKILYFMAKDNEIDSDLVKFFVDNKIYLKYAQDNLTKNQIDEITVNFDDL